MDGNIARLFAHLWGHKKWASHTWSLESMKVVDNKRACHRIRHTRDRWATLSCPYGQLSYILHFIYHVLHYAWAKERALFILLVNLQEVYVWYLSYILSEQFIRQAITYKVFTWRVENSYSYVNSDAEFWLAYGDDHSWSFESVGKRTYYIFPNFPFSLIFCHLI